MFRLSGRDITKAAYSHGHQVEIVAHPVRGSEMTLATLPPMVDGTINFVSSGIRRRCNVTFESQNPGTRFLNLVKDDRARWQVFLGIDVLYPMGVFYLRDVSIDDTGQNRNYRLSLQDESALIATRKTTKAAVYSGDVIEVAQQILQAAGRALVFDGVGAINVPLLNYFVDYGKDPIAIVEQLLTGYGYEMLFGRTGECIFRMIPDDPSYIFSPDITSLVLSQQIVQQRRGTNHIAVVSTPSTGGQVRTDVYDLDRDSPTFIYGSYGDVQETYTVDGLLTPEALSRAASRIASKQFQRQATHTYSCLQNPKVDLGDGYTTGGYRYTADQLAYSLIAGRPMYLTGRGVHV